MEIGTALPDQSRRKLLDAGLELIARRGALAVSIEDAAERAEVDPEKARSIFSGPQQLLEALLERHARKLDVWLAVAPAVRDGYMRRNEFIDYLLDTIIANENYFRLMLGVLIQPAALELSETRAHDLYRSVYRRLAAALPDLPGPGKRADRAKSFLMSLQGAMASHYLDPSEFRFQAIRRILKHQYGEGASSPQPEST